MILYEYEGKEILKNAGINVPASQVITTTGQKVVIKPPLVLKAQVLSGKRAVAGGIIYVKNKKDLIKQISRLFRMKINGEVVEKILIEEKVEFSKQYYLSISYDTGYRSPIVTFSKVGGTGIEERKPKVTPVDILNPEETKILLPSLAQLFLDSDMLLLEINPLVTDRKGNLVALDAKIKLDDAAFARHPEWSFAQRSVAGHISTKNEIEAKKIDEGDYRGTAGSTYFDLPGDIAILASGGGASLAAMDALLSFGGYPANYTEYSGNPPKEKVERLTKIVLSKKGLRGLWVGGAIANFTNIYETLSGFLQALRKIKPKPRFPIVIRRGGPKDKEAFEMLQGVKDFDLHLFGEQISMTESAKIMADLAKKYAANS